MRRPREPETQSQQDRRLEQEHQSRLDDAAAEAKALDAAVRQSIKMHGP